MIPIILSKKQISVLVAALTDYINYSDDSDNLEMAMALLDDLDTYSHELESDE